MDKFHMCWLSLMKRATVKVQLEYQDKSENLSDYSLALTLTPGKKRERKRLKFEKFKSTVDLCNIRGL